jgi:hypothetical protein
VVVNHENAKASESPANSLGVLGGRGIPASYTRWRLNLLTVCLLSCSQDRVCVCVPYICDA